MRHYSAVKPSAADSPWGRHTSIKRLVLLPAAIISAAVVLPSALGQGAPDLPPGVREADWKPISDSLGVVLVPSQPGIILNVGPGQPRIVGGYFMVKQDNVWRRLVVIGPT
jgi:hypothetical protein